MRVNILLFLSLLVVVLMLVSVLVTMFPSYRLLREFNLEEDCTVSGSGIFVDDLPVMKTAELNCVRNY